MPRARLILKGIPATSYPIDGNQLIIGRSEECDIRLSDRFASRRQACLRATTGGYELENLGTNPILVNGSPVERKLLEEEDVITLGKTDFVFRLDKEQEAGVRLSPEQEAMEAMTVFLSLPRVEPHGPRFLVTDPEGKTTVHGIEKDALLLGRSAESDVVLSHPTVSRRQAVVRRRNGGYMVRNVSVAASLTLNGKPVTEERLYSGDEMTLGAFRITFLSDRPEDSGPPPADTPPVHAPQRSSPWPAWAALIVVLLSVGAYAAYDRWYLPTQSGKALSQAMEEAATAEYPKAREKLTALLQERLPGEAEERALALLSRLTLAEARRSAEAGEGREARSLLAAFVAQYGAGGVGRAVQELLDELRFQAGQQEEARGEHLAALQEFSAISIESPCYEEAQTAVSRIWQSYQQNSAPQLPIAQLLDEAEIHFAAKRYTTPLGQNAYALYKSVLVMEPDNPLALQRMEEMKAFYREVGGRYLRQKDCQAALPYLERYLMIDPRASDIRTMANSCRKTTQTRRPRPAPASATGPGESAQQDRVKALLEEPAPQESPP